ncbi:MAG: hypothetical protein L6V93_11725 [Clostridiales bacterium]|nr:MAG: hypothetical protein L6V93_11725 [Clostridiales bacterium]
MNSEICKVMHKISGKPLAKMG